MEGHIQLFALCLRKWVSCLTYVKLENHWWFSPSLQTFQLLVFEFLRRTTDNHAPSEVALRWGLSDGKKRLSVLTIEPAGFALRDH